MLQLIGLIVAVYAVARLVQVPIEHSTLSQKTGVLMVVSIFAVGAIGLLTFGLMTATFEMPR